MAVHYYIKQFATDCAKRPECCSVLPQNHEIDKNFS